MLTEANKKITDGCYAPGNHTAGANKGRQFNVTLVFTRPPRKDLFIIRL